MVASFDQKKSLVLLMVLLFLFVSSSYAKFSMMVTKSEIDTICTEENMNSSFCFDFFKTTPEVARLDYSNLIKYVINYQTRYISDTVKLFKLSGGYSKDINSTYHVCVEVYELAINKHDASLRYLAAKDYQSLNIVVSGTMTDVRTCIDEDLSIMKPVPQLFMTRSDAIKDLSLVILVVLECFIRKDPELCP
ncbi:hypothetical protein CARUB_v10012549mg [Capsella rubella]|uniref:Pectinesterase inhibitor domain-containing protein n=1 Tax=Capsella rubella TaxID=81985 RepID=R0GPN3_9BRAS|nr:uncharacterized protein LOC17897045 [Capsella rubella]EOA37746.1 hypothetical protein CARUB_v10012549mg [Capsella rubella]